MLLRVPRLYPYGLGGYSMLGFGDGACRLTACTHPMHCSLKWPGRWLPVHVHARTHGHVPTDACCACWRGTAPEGCNAAPYMHQ